MNVNKREAAWYFKITTCRCHSNTLKEYNNLIKRGEIWLIKKVGNLQLVIYNYWYKQK